MGDRRARPGIGSPRELIAPGVPAAAATRGTARRSLLAAAACVAVLGGPSATTLAAQEPTPPDTAPNRPLFPAPSEGVPSSPLRPALPSAPADSLDLVDRIVAVVGDTTILLSEIRQEILRLRQQGVEIPQNPGKLDSLMYTTLEGLIDRTLLLERAKQVGVEVSEENVEAQAEEQFQEVRSNFPSDEAFRDAVEGAGQNMFQYREVLRERARQQLLLSRFRQQLMTSGDLPPASVSEEEIRDYFERNAAQAQRPATVSFVRIQIAPEPGEAAEDSARSLARRALEEIREEGIAFEVAARRYSDDEGSREEGGDLGWIRRAEVVPRFADAAWAAPPGRAVGPIRTRFGFHVIKVNNTRGSERRVQHILVRPEITEEDVQRARERAEALRDSVRGGADAERLANDHGLPGEQVVFGGVRMDRLSDRMGGEYGRALRSPTVGRVAGPIRIPGAFGIPIFVVLEVTDHQPAGNYELEDVRNDIRQRLLRAKQFDRYMERLRQQMYVRLLV